MALTTLAKSIVLFVVAAIAEIGGAWLIWQGAREHRGLLWIGAGVIALGLYGFVATLQFKPDRWDIIGALICLNGVAVIMYGPRTT